MVDARRLVVDPDAMRSSAIAYTDLGDAADRILTGLKATIDRIGNCWGSDETGDAFATSYVQFRDQLVPGITGIGAMLYQIGNGIHVSADAYEAADLAAAG
jgi:WXG100 family type VII secretion target